MNILSKLFKRKNKQIEDDEYEDGPIFTDEELELMRTKADVEAVNIYSKIYSLFKEHISELKEGDNFILLYENPIKLCDYEELNKSIIFSAIYHNHRKLRELIPELDIEFAEIKPELDIEFAEIKVCDGPYILRFNKCYLYTINITHDNIIELYDVKFIVKPSRPQINNGNEICVTVYSVDKKIYKII